ncbi:MAG: HPr kinase/phosphorylase [Methylovirgula sp.]
MSAAQESAASGPAQGESLHATAVVIGETGLLIRGPSGAGKSNLAHALIAYAAQIGQFGRLIGDDRILLSAANGRLIARGHGAALGMIELRGQGIVSMRFEPAAVLGFVIDLVAPEEALRYPDVNERQIELCGVKLRRLALPAGRSSYDCALLIVAALRQSETL